MVTSFQGTMTILSSYIKETLPVSISLPYSLTCLAFLSTERELLGCTASGLCIHFAIYSRKTITIEISSNSLSNILLYKNDTLALIQDIFVVHCLDIVSMRPMQTINLSGNSRILQIFMTPDENYLFGAIKTGEVIKLDTSSFRNYHKVVFSDSSLIFFSMSIDYMIIAGIGKKLVLFSINFDKVCERLFPITAKTKISFSSSGKYVILSQNLQICLLYRSTLETLYSVTLTSEVACSLITREEKYLIITEASGHVLFLNSSTGTQLISIPLYAKTIDSFYVTRDLSTLYVVSQSSLITLKFPKMQQLKNCEVLPSTSIDFQQDFKILARVQAPDNDLMIQAGYSKEIFVWKVFETGLRKLAGHEDIVLCLHTLNNRILASGSNDCDIRLWDYRKCISKGRLRGHVSGVTCLSSRHKFLVSGSHDYTVKVWRWQDLVLIHTINLGYEIYGLCCWGDAFIIATSQSLGLWDLQSLGFMAKKTFLFEITCLEAINEGKQLLVNKSQGICIDNPLAATEICIWGDDNYYEFIEYIQRVFNNSVPLHLQNMDNFIILPYKISILSIYAFKNLHKHIESSIHSGASIFNSSNLDNPITIALENHHKGCISSILQACSTNKSYPFQYGVLQCIDLISLNLISPEEIHVLYRKLWKESLTVLPKYCNYHTALPITVLSDSNVIYSTKFLPASDATIGKELQYFTSLVALPIDLGTQLSVLFMESLGKSHVSIFSAELIQNIIDYKWRKIRWYIAAEAAVFLVYFTYLIASIVYLNSKASLIQANVFSCLMSLWMVYKIFAAMSLSLWNIVDIFRLLLLVVYSIEKFSNSPYQIEYVLIFVILLSVVQGMQYFCLFMHTRLIVNKIITGLARFLSFSSVIAYLLGALAAVMLISGYQIEFENKQWKVLHSALSSAVSIIMLCVLLSLGNNLRVAGRLEDFEELARIICMQEKLIFWRRAKVSLKYFQQCRQSKKERKSNVTKLMNNAGALKVENIEIVGKIDSLCKGFMHLEELAKSL